MTKIYKMKAFHFKKKHHDIIIGTLSKITKPLTYKEIAKRSRLDSTAVGRRLSELVRENRIKKLDSRICPIAKSRCATYVLAD